MKSLALRTPALLLALACSLAALPPARAQSGSASVAVGSGLHTVTFTAPAGQVRVYLPDDMMAGDMISGSVVADPSGATDAERGANAGALNGYTIALDSRAVSGRAFSDRLIAVPRSVALMKNGAVVATATLPPRPPVDNAAAPATPSPADYHLPVLAQAGSPLRITGPFDGDAANTNCSVGGEPTPVIAESPRQSICRIPSQPVGPTPIAITERGVTASGSVRVLHIRLIAGRTKLVTGEQTSLEFRVDGLQGWMPEPGTPPVSVVVTDRSPAVVTFVNQPPRWIAVITAADVQPDGSVTRTVMLQGVVPGDFQVSAVLLSAAPIDMRKIKNAKELEGYSVEELEATLADLRARKAHDAENGGTAQSWFAEQIKLVKHVIRKLDATDPVAKDRPGDE